MSKSWVDIKKNNQILRVPYQAFKDVFEHDGFTLVVDESLSVEPTFSISSANIKEAPKNNQEQKTDSVVAGKDQGDAVNTNKGGLSKNANNKKRSSNNKG